MKKLEESLEVQLFVHFNGMKLTVGGFCWNRPRSYSVSMTTHWQKWRCWKSASERELKNGSALPWWYSFVPTVRTHTIGRRALGGRSPLLCGNHLRRDGTCSEKRCYYCDYCYYCACALLLLLLLLVLERGNSTKRAGWCLFRCFIFRDKVVCNERIARVTMKSCSARMNLMDLSNG